MGQLSRQYISGNDKSQARSSPNMLNDENYVPRRTELNADYSVRSRFKADRCLNGNTAQVLSYYE